MVLDGVVHPLDIPSKASITKWVRSDLLMSHKKLSVTPLESTTANNVALKDTYLDQVSDLNPATLHFFDESSVLKTTANRHFGSSYVGQAAFEFQKYASNATYTLNLLHSMQGVDYINIIDSPSNGNTMLLFFEEAVELQNNDGSAILERGDTVIMDNCSFHHGHFVESLLTDMLVRSTSLVSASLFATPEYMHAVFSSNKVLPETQAASCSTANRNCNFGCMS